MMEPCCSPLDPRNRPQAPSCASYKGYLAWTWWDARSDLFVGKLAGISDLIYFHAKTEAEVQHAFEEAVDDYVLTCQEIGRLPQRSDASPC